MTYNYNCNNFYYSSLSSILFILERKFSFPCYECFICVLHLHITYIHTYNTSCFIHNKCQPRVFLHVKKKTIPTWRSSESTVSRLCHFTLRRFLYGKAVLLGAIDASFTTRRINLIRELDIFLPRPCHCPRGLYYLYRVDLKSWALAEIKMSSLTSRGTNSAVCKRFRRAITRKTRRDRNFYHGPAKRPEILITCLFYRMLSALSR